MARTPNGQVLDKTKQCLRVTMLKWQDLWLSMKMPKIHCIVHGSKVYSNHGDPSLAIILIVPLLKLVVPGPMHGIIGTSG
jgi:hypothetical protein